MCIQDTMECCLQLEILVLLLLKQLNTDKAWVQKLFFFLHLIRFLYFLDHKYYLLRKFLLWSGI